MNENGPMARQTSKQIEIFKNTQLGISCSGLAWKPSITYVLMLISNLYFSFSASSFHCNNVFPVLNFPGFKPLGQAGSEMYQHIIMHDELGHSQPKYFHNRPHNQFRAQNFEKVFALVLMNHTCHLKYCKVLRHFGDHIILDQHFQ